MRTAMRPRYYCDHCNKGNGSPSAMRRHERGCSAASGQIDLFTAPQMHAYGVECRRQAFTDAALSMRAAAREVFDAEGPETPQIVRDVIEYCAEIVRVKGNAND